MANKRDKAYDSMVREYKKLAKRADQRLIRLEELADTKGYNNVLSWAYMKAMKDIKYWAGQDAQRFNTKAPNNMNLLKAKIRDIQNFLESATSTKKGITKTYKKRADTINKKYGTNFKWQDMANYFERKANIKTDKEYGSKTMLKAIGEIQDNERKIIKSIKSGEGVDLHIENKLVSEAVNDLIKNYGMSVVDLY